MLTFKAHDGMGRLTDGAIQKPLLGRDLGVTVSLYVYPVCLNENDL